MIWSSPCRRISGSETPSLSTRSRMISTERSRSASVSSCPALRRLRLEHDLEAALEVEAERRRPEEREHDDAGDGAEEGDQDEEVPAHASTARLA